MNIQKISANPKFENKLCLCFTTKRRVAKRRDVFLFSFLFYICIKKKIRIGLLNENTHDSLQLLV